MPLSRVPCMLNTCVCFRLTPMIRQIFRELHQNMAARVGTSLGTMEMGRNACVEAVPSKMVKAYLARQDIGTHELDTAIMYCGGNTEKILG